MNKEGAPPPVPLVVTYTPFYCEETVYYLAQTYYRYSKEIRDNWDLTVVFVSNADEKVALWNQNVGDPDEPMNPTIWDYHCFLAMHGHGRSWVIDYSSRLEMPCPLSGVFLCAVSNLAP